MAIEVVVLGRAQDAGVPQAGCSCPRCAAAWAGRAPREYAACLAVVDSTSNEAWLIDATPDLREQLALLNEMRPAVRLAGVFITHAHVGHYTGLIHFGREAMNTSGLPIYATKRVCDFLRTNGPWSQLVALGNVELREQEDVGTVALSEELQIEFIPVPHRGEFSDTSAFAIGGPSRSLFYCPDIDAWEAWKQDVRGLPDRFDFSLIDGTFFSPDELPGRDMSIIPHPTIEHTMQLIGDGHGRVFFAHLNHTNPLLDGGEAARLLDARGFAVVKHGQTFALEK